MTCRHGALKCKFAGKCPSIIDRSSHQAIKRMRGVQKAAHALPLLVLISSTLHLDFVVYEQSIIRPLHAPNR